MRNVGILVLAVSVVSGMVVASGACSSSPSTTGPTGSTTTGPTTSSHASTTSTGVTTGVGGSGGAGGAGTGGAGTGGAAAHFECTVPAMPPSMGSCVVFGSASGGTGGGDAGSGDAGDAGSGDAGDSGDAGGTLNSCNPITNAGCTAGEWCGPDNFSLFYFCQPSVPHPAATCGPCSSPQSCEIGDLCLHVAHSNDEWCARLCCNDADCGAGTCDMNITPPLPSGVGYCTP